MAEPRSALATVWARALVTPSFHIYIALLLTNDHENCAVVTPKKQALPTPDVHEVERVSSVKV
jgi:hypothetical protein